MGTLFSVADVSKPLAQSELKKCEAARSVKELGMTAQ